jgi:hypothetical protein
MVDIHFIDGKNFWSWPKLSGQGMYQYRNIISDATIDLSW